MVVDHLNAAEDIYLVKYGTAGMMISTSIQPWIALPRVVLRVIDFYLPPISIVFRSCYAEVSV